MPVVISSASQILLLVHYLISQCLKNDSAILGKCCAILGKHGRCIRIHLVSMHRFGHNLLVFCAKAHCFDAEA